MTRVIPSEKRQASWRWNAAMNSVFLTYNAGYFECRCRFEDNKQPKLAGFFWSPADRCWKTDSWAKANIIRQFADFKAEAMLRQHGTSAISKVNVPHSDEWERGLNAPKHPPGRFNRVRHK